MRAATAVMIASILICGCGKKTQSSRSGSRSTEEAEAEHCRIIKKRNLECLDVLVPLAQNNARQLMEKALQQVDESQREQLKAQMLSAISASKPELAKTLREGLKGPFMKWCTRAQQRPDQARVLARVKGCLKNTDCMAYSQCLGTIMETMQDRLLNRTAPPNARTRP